jgi:hypothetical protein
MTRGRCQICGRLKPLKVSGVMVHHHVKGVPCTGKNHPPLEADDAHLEAEAKRLYAVSDAKRALVRDMLARRVNFIDPAHEAIASAAWDQAYKLERRLKRHRDWPARYHRQMERYGMAMPAPSYLLERMKDQAHG